MQRATKASSKTLHSIDDAIDKINATESRLADKIQSLLAEICSKVKPFPRFVAILETRRGNKAVKRKGIIVETNYFGGDTHYVVLLDNGEIVEYGSAQAQTPKGKVLAPDLSMRDSSNEKYLEHSVTALIYLRKNLDSK